MTALELLRVQAEGALDARDRVAGLWGAWIVRTDEEQALWIGAEVPDELASALAAALDPAATAVERCRALLEARVGALPLRAGPSFLIEEAAQLTSRVRIERSDGASIEALRDKNPGNWHAIEWDELLDGRLGPWAMALDGGRVVSLCHTPRPLTARSAEAGVWTHPEFRGRGHAVAVVSEWAALLRPTGRHLFYSTTADNVSSQHVAARLRLRLLGWTWQLGRARDHDERGYHPLSVLSRR